MGDDVVPAACGPINFFGSDESGRTFTDRVNGTFLLTIEQGLELARLIAQPGERAQPIAAVRHPEVETEAPARHSVRTRLGERPRQGAKRGVASAPVVRVTRARVGVRVHRSRLRDRRWV
jgi:hypothetical protein